jgi:hypothetical protein
MAEGIIAARAILATGGGRPKHLERVPYGEPRAETGLVPLSRPTSIDYGRKELRRARSLAQCL